MANIKKNRQRWEKMDKNDIPIPPLVDHYIITCRTEGKTPAILLGHRVKLRRFIKWSENATLADFSVEMVREYISYLQATPKYEGHPYNPYRRPPCLLLTFVITSRHPPPSQIHLPLNVSHYR